MSSRSGVFSAPAKNKGAYGTLRPGTPSGGRSLLLQVQAQVQERLSQDAGVAEQEGDQQPADAAVAVKERVDRLEGHTVVSV
jgi:hypothetical protein